MPLHASLTVFHVGLQQQDHNLWKLCKMPLVSAAKDEQFEANRETIVSHSLWPPQVDLRVMQGVSLMGLHIAFEVAWDKS